MRSTKWAGNIEEICNSFPQGQIGSLWFFRLKQVDDLVVELMMYLMSSEGAYQAYRFGIPKHRAMLEAFFDAYEKGCSRKSVFTDFLDSPFNII